MRATAFRLALLSLSMLIAPSLAAQDRDETRPDTTVQTQPGSPPEVSTETAAEAKRRMRDVRSFLAQNQPSSARCLYRSLQRLDPSLMQKKVEEAVRAFEADEQKAWPGPLDPDWVRDQDLLPRKVHTVMPVYPPRARASGIEGTVGLRATVTRDGLVAEVAIVDSLAPALDLEALVAVCQWRFEPVQVDGQAIDIYYNLIINLSLGTQRPTR